MVRCRKKIEGEKCRKLRLVFVRDKLANYLMLKLYDNDDREKASSVPNWRTGRSIHKLNRLDFLAQFSTFCFQFASRFDQTFATFGIFRTLHFNQQSRSKVFSSNFFSLRSFFPFQEGTVCIYNDQMQLYKSSKATTESCKMRDLWITDFVLMPNVSKVAIAYTSKELSKNFAPKTNSIENFSSRSYLRHDLEIGAEFGLSSGRHRRDAFLFGLLVKKKFVDRKKNSKIFVSIFRFDPENTNDAILCWGDVKGNVHALLFNSAIIALFERPSQQTSGTGRKFSSNKILFVYREKFSSLFQLTIAFIWTISTKAIIKMRRI